MIAVSLAAWCAVTAPVVELAPSEYVGVVAEQTKLSKDKPRVWAEGTKLRNLQTIRPGVGTPAPGAVDPASVVVKRDGVVLQRDVDYLLDPLWGSLGVGPSGKVTPNDVVTVDYRYSLLRLDSLVKDAAGQEVVRQGKPDLNCPEPPALQPGETRLGNWLVPYHSDGKNGVWFATTARAEDAPTASTAGRIPRTLAKIAAGQPVKIVCWGDSVTTGGDVSAPQFRYPDVFAARLKAKYPDKPITVAVHAVGGSNSLQWLFPDKYPFPNPALLPQCNWERVVEAKPDLVTLEFVNDAGLQGENFQRHYELILSKVQALGAELILITPHFTMPSMMGFSSLLEPEKRPYVLALREFATTHQLALADAAARWEHLAKEGIPYTTLLRNGINHPDDRGHALFADELLKCFAP
ncbi:MAG: hypothetical protein IT204_18700 [Fimbriimonadaceae bacterium]|nr:hypothetical protein [Fimbriimonadaceae bacterium]